ncbi:ImmA/IrrE family metallo-endopeptidase [Calorimonas adulescens]|uniref:ImmA/IrrE family metallo-endopeptidase n=1 Tax=Calorimonas adulescens TaxID=2606906 RepID=A0A5D8QDR0_9THEO|nr:ImmA/IrrE family metallo-endopeptidase [Calorimonas adulescens]TZE81976.1 ImmA/IrrE family metallo-endopeptidase [Calorimonas adulescens]
MNNKYQWIDDFIAGLFELYKTLNIYELYDELCITIKKLPKENILFQGNEALYYRNYDGMEIVFIRNDLDIHYEKFVLAHELAHAIIHVDIYNAAFNKNLINIGKLDKQANYFALKLLNINLFDKDFEDLTIEQIARALYLPKKWLLNILE